MTTVKSEAHGRCQIQRVLPGDPSQASHSCCLFLDLSVVSVGKASLLDWDQTADLASPWLGIIPSLQKDFSCSHSTFRVIIHLLCEVSFVAFRWLWAKSRAIDLRVHLASSVNSHITIKHPWGWSTGSRTRPHHDTAWTVFDSWCGLQWVVSYSDKKFMLCFLSL